MLLVKKYPNRRLYDTRNSRYVTLEDLEGIIRKGDDIAVQDAHSGEDLTQEVLTQIILERGNGKLLPSALLLRLIRLDDAALGEFLTRYVSWALDMYLQAKERTTSLFNGSPLANAPFAAADALARFALENSPYARFARAVDARRAPGPESSFLDPPPVAAPPPPPPPPVEEAAVPTIDVNVRMQQIQEQLEALKSQLGAVSVMKKRAKPAKKRASSKS